MRRLVLLAVVLVAPSALAQIHPGLSGEALRAALRADYTPVQTLGYGPARDSLFAWHQRTSGGVRCVYTGFTVSVAGGGDPSDAAYAQGINTEHTVPQSQGASSEPARSNLHHLFPTREVANSARGSLPFADIPDAQTDAWYRLTAVQTSIPTTFLDEWSERDAAAFEPREDHKGNAARAVLYFATIYPSAIGASFFEAQRATLLAWHAADPVDAAETARDLWIAQKQGRRNPFVADATLAERAFGTGGGPPPPPPSGAEVWVNELHYDNDGTDAGEGVEVAGPAGASLAGWSLVLYNGSGGASYATVPLSGTLPDEGAGLGARWFAAPGLQNGSPDGLALVRPDNSVAQFLSYEGTFTASGGPANGLASADIGVEEPSTTPLGHSLQLTGAGETAADFAWTGPLAGSPGLLNAGQTVRRTVAQPVADVAGWRLLSAPVAGLRVDDLAAINLVQGVPAGAATPAQYPLAAPNLLVGHAGGAFVAPAATDAALEPGRGFFWHLRDEDLTPSPSASGGGTSASVELSDFALVAAGAPLVADVTRAFAGGPYLMAGNPFTAPLAVDGITSGTVTLASAVLVYDPVAGYAPRFATNPATGEPDLLAPWQGAWVEVAAAAPGATPTVTYVAASVVPDGEAPFVGRTAGPTPAPAPYVAFRITGETLSGAPVADAAAWVRWLPDALPGRDAHDLTRPAAPAGPSAELAPLANGVPHAVLSLPVAPATVPLALRADDAASLTLAWTTALPVGWTARLRDLVTGVDVALGPAGEIAVEAGAGEWTERFALVVEAGVVAGEDAPEAALSVSAVSPNPSAGAARVTVRAAGRVRVTVLDALGRTVATAFDGVLAGEARAVDLPAGLAAGVYAVRVESGEAVSTVRWVVAR